MVPAASVLQSLCLHTIFLQTTRLPYSWNSGLLCQPTTAWNLFMHDTCIFAQKIKVAQGKIHTCQRLLVSAPSTVAEWVLIPLTQAWKMGSSCSLNPPDRVYLEEQGEVALAGADMAGHKDSLPPAQVSPASLSSFPCFPTLIPPFTAFASRISLETSH